MNLFLLDMGAPLIGGALIGLAASLFLLAHGRVAGISGLLGGLLQSSPTDVPIRGWFLFGLMLAGLFARAVFPGTFEKVATPGVGIAIASGLLVGFGTRLGNGCTSGHGVCGISRLSVRSLFATVTFISAGALTVLFTRLLGGR